MFFKINADILFFDLFQRGIDLLRCCFAGCTGQDAVTRGAKLVFCRFQSLFEICAKVDELNVAHIRDIVCTIRFEGYIFRNCLDQCNLPCQLINFIKGQREVI